MRLAVVGLGSVGARAARQLLSTPSVAQVAVVDPDGARAAEVVTSLGNQSLACSFGEAVTQADAVVLAAEADHVELAREAMDSGVRVVVSVADSVEQVRGLLALNDRARERGITVVVGAGMAPGLTCVLARHAALGLDRVTQVHVAKHSTGGPACARLHHRALGQAGYEWADGVWTAHPGGSGRELVWFPDPIDGLDCYRAALPDPYLLVGAFSEAERLTSRVSATRRDRMTARLPMLWKPHQEGEVGAVRVEVRGLRAGIHTTVVYGAMDRPGVAAGAVAAAAARWGMEGRFRRSGAAGLAELLNGTAEFLTELAKRGVKAAVFEGSSPYR